MVTGQHRKRLEKSTLDQNIKQRIELSGPNEGDISLKHFDLNQLDTTELEQLDSILSKQKKFKNASDVWPRRDQKTHFAENLKTSSSIQSQNINSIGIMIT